MRRSLMIPGFVGFLFAILVSACGTAPKAAPTSPAVPAATAPVVAATAAPATAVPATAVPATTAPTDAPTAVAATAVVTATAAVTTTAAAATTAAPAGAVLQAPAGAYVAADTPENAGKYIIGWLGNCNDCHSPGWGTRPYEGRIPMENWLMGGEKNVSAAGVSYSANLRLVPGRVTVTEFIDWFRTREHPRMPWNYYHGLNEKDLTSIYAFLKSLGPKGEMVTPYATSTPKPTVDSAAPTATAAPTTDPAAPTNTPAAPTPIAPTATPRSDLLAPEKRETAPPEAFVTADKPEVAGEYIVWIGRCNSCHTADRATGVVNWTPTTPKADWLMGGRKSSGNYGTVYSANLRLVPQNYTEDEFVKMLKTREVNPNMPWFALHQFNEKDLRSVYAFLKSLGPKGEPVPPFVPLAPAPTAKP